MLKLIITGLIIYGVYKFFIASPKPLKTQQNEKINQQEPTDDEYIDFEEVE